MRELDRELLEAGRLEPGLVFALRERAGDASDVRAALRALLGREPVLGDDVADPDSPARLEHAGDLGQNGGLVDRQVDHAVRDHDVDRVRGERDLLDHALEEVRRCRRRPRARCAARARASRRSCPARTRYRSGRPASPTGSRRCRRRSRGRAPSLPRAARRPRSGCRSRARPASPSRGARRAARRRRAPRRTGSRRFPRPRSTSRRRNRSARPLAHHARRLRVPPSHLLAQLLSRRRHQQHTPFRSATTASFSTASRLNEKYAHLPRCSRSSRPASTSFFR